jgi:hypothetical protein
VGALTPSPRRRSTGRDGWVPNGGGTENTVAALGDPATAGIGAGGGLLSTPWPWVWLSTWVTLVIGVLLGWISAKVAATITPRPRAAAAETA